MVLTISAKQFLMNTYKKLTFLLKKVKKSLNFIFSLDYYNNKLQKTKLDMNMNAGGMAPQFGPDMADDAKGKWINRYTGDTVLVRDIVFADDGMNVITNKGMLDGDQFADYIKCSDEIYDSHGNVIDKSTVESINVEQPSNDASAESALNAELLFAGMHSEENDLSFEEDLSLLTTTQPNTEQDKKSTNIKTQNPESSNISNIVIDKVLNKVSKPKISLSITWDDFPAAEINTLINYLDIDINTFVEYLVNDFPKQEYYDLVKSYIEKELQK